MIKTEYLVIDKIRSFDELYSAVDNAINNWLYKIADDYDLVSNRYHGNLISHVDGLPKVYKTLKEAEDYLKQFEGKLEDHIVYFTLTVADMSKEQK